jgi:hypothetical protein
MLTAPYNGKRGTQCNAAAVIWYAEIETGSLNVKLKVTKLQNPPPPPPRSLNLVTNIGVDSADANSE